MVARRASESHLTDGRDGEAQQPCYDASIATRPLSACLGTARPLVSIVVPAYNGACFLREALDSLLAQTYENIEIILLDDASTDATPQVAAEYADRIRYIRQPRNLGIYDNVNVGIALARGEFIATYHADDVYLPTIVQAQVEYLLAYANVGAVFCSDIFVDAEGREYGRIVLPPDVRGERPLNYATVVNTLLKYKNRFLVCPTAMVRAAVHREVGVYDQNRYRNTADLEMWLRIARHCPIAVLESHLMKYRHFHSNSSQRYHYLRTAPNNYFVIMDEYLSAGARSVAAPQSLVSYEAHRSEDRLMAAISHYIKGELGLGRRALHEVQVSAIVSTRQVQRWRLLVLIAGMWVLLRLPRVAPLAHLMHQRWHVKRPPARARRVQSRMASYQGQAS
jgi:GT2 family glycosyltransferase